MTVSEATAHLRSNPMTMIEAALWLKQQGLGLSDSHKVLAAIYPAPVRGD